jgi:hypothetical protein
MSVRAADVMMPPASTNLDIGAMTPHMTLEPRRATCPVLCCLIVDIVRLIFWVAKIIIIFVI